MNLFKYLKTFGSIRIMIHISISVIKNNNCLMYKIYYNIFI